MKNSESSGTDVPEKSRYDYIKASLVAFTQHRATLGLGITDDELRAEARRIYVNKFNKSASDLNGNGLTSWFGEMIMCSEDASLLDDLQKKATIEAGSRAGANYPSPDLNDRVATEKLCEFEEQLKSYVNAQRPGVVPTDEELRAAACRIILAYDKKFSAVKSAAAAIFFCNQTMSSHSWLASFRQRISLPPSLEPENPKTSVPVDASIGKYQKFEDDMAGFFNEQIALGIVPADAKLQNQARLLAADLDDPFLQGVADDVLWLARFKHARRGLPTAQTNTPSPPGSRRPFSRTGRIPGTKSRSNTMDDDQLLRPPKRSMSAKSRPQPVYGPREAKSWQHLEFELSRYIASCMSVNPTNPQIPSDDEIRTQARWITYDNSPWDQTPADNPEWLLRFKQSIGVAPRDESSRAVDMQYGDSGLAHGLLPTASILHPDDTIAPNPPASSDWPPQPPPPQPPHSSASKAAPHMAAVAGVFPSCDLESGLATYAASVMAQGFCPSDDDLRAQARLITGLHVTAADDPLLLLKFRRLYGLAYTTVALPDEALSLSVNLHRLSPVPQSLPRPPPAPFAPPLMPTPGPHHGLDWEGLGLITTYDHPPLRRN